MKVAFLVASQEIGEELRALVDDILLNVSPFHLELVRRYAEYSSTEGRDYDSIRGLIATNRERLRKEIAAVPDLLQVAYPESMVGVEVLNVAAANYPSFLNALEQRKVAVLPTDKFYWGPRREPLKSQIRIALCRDPDDMSNALGHFMEAAVEVLDNRTHDGC